MARKFLSDVLSLLWPRHRVASPPSAAGPRLSENTAVDLLLVKHDREKHKFSITLNESSEEAVLLYDYVGKGTVDLRSTVVPAVFRGQGVGTLLAQAALNFVVEEDLKAHISCWFIKKYLEKHPLPQYEERIVN